MPRDISKNFRNRIATLRKEEPPSEVKSDYEAAIMPSAAARSSGGADQQSDSERVKLKRLHVAICRMLVELESSCEYVYVAFDSALPGSWISLAVESMEEVRVRAAIDNSKRPRSAVEFDDLRRMGLAPFKRWALEHTAVGAITREREEIKNGYQPVGRRTYKEGFEFGEQWARSLTVTKLLRFREWCGEHQADSDRDAEQLWLAVYGDTFEDDDEERAALHKFWNIDSDAWGRISRLPEQYLRGFRVAAQGVANRVARNVR